MSKRKTDEQFQNEVLEQGFGEYEVLSLYQNSREKILMKHRTCGNEYWVRPDKFQEGRRCPACKKNAKSHETFEKEVHSRLGKNYELLSKYKNCATNVLLKHTTCGHEQWIRPDNIRTKTRCSNCERIHVNNSDLQRRNFANDVEILGNNEYTLISTYESRRKKVILKHLVCGHEYDVVARCFINGGGRCPKCHPTRNFSIDNASKRFLAKTPEQFKKEVETLYGKDFEVLTDYVKSEEKVKIKHAIDTCGFEFWMTPKHFLTGTTCLKCREKNLGNSKGSKMVENILIELGLPYEREVRFDECRYKQPLPFDFAVKNEKGEPVFLIEYDGEQHFKPVKYFGGMKRYVRQLRHDRIKSTFSKENNLPLLRVRYDQKDSEKFVRHALKHFVQKHLGNAV